MHVAVQTYKTAGSPRSETKNLTYRKKKVYKFKHSIQREVFINLYIIYIQIKVYIEALIITWFTFRRVIHTRRDIRTFQLNSPFPLWKVKINTVTLKSKCIGNETTCLAWSYKQPKKKGQASSFYLPHKKMVPSS
jgi:hypothetical protein